MDTTGGGWPRDCGPRAGGRRAAGQCVADEEPAARQQPRRRSDGAQRLEARPRRSGLGAHEHALSEVASRQQRERERERRRHVEQPGLQPGEMQPEHGHRGHHEKRERDARTWARAHRTGTFSVVVYSSKSETRSVTSSLQSPPGTSCTVLAA